MKSYKEISKEELHFLIREAQSGNIEARNQIIEVYQGFVRSVALSFYNPSLELMDLIQEGNLALIKAINTFDESKNVLFTTYADRLLKFHLIDVIETKSTVIRAPKGWIGRKRKWKEENANYSRTVLSNRLAVANIVYNTVPLGNAEGLADSKIRPDRIVESEMTKADLKLALSQISPREYTIINMHYGLDGEDLKSLRIIGHFLGVCGARIGIIEKRALKKLRSFMESHCIAPTHPLERLV